MTLAYLFLGRPQNQKEFDREMKRKKICSLNIAMGYSEDSSNGRRSITYFPVLQAGGIEMELMDSSKIVTEVPNERTEVKEIHAQNETFKEMLSLARQYREGGFTVTLIGKPSEDARKEFEVNQSMRMATFDPD
ncbi:MAG TPA: hypothetical protein VJ142_01150 [Candidatus Nanoarchaeia archaeon]|nr:hypothetical protein [Candidatus Nanoarchaeia archaeon]